MKLVFTKNEEGEISVEVNDSLFETKDYVEMIKGIKKGDKVEVSYDEVFTSEETEKIDSMIDKINDISSDDDEDINSDSESGEDSNLPVF